MAEILKGVTAALVVALVTILVLGAVLDATVPMTLAPSVVEGAAIAATVLGSWVWLRTGRALLAAGSVLALVLLAGILAPVSVLAHVAWTPIGWAALLTIAARGATLSSRPGSRATPAEQIPTDVG